MLPQVSDLRFFLSRQTCPLIEEPARGRTTFQ